MSELTPQPGQCRYCGATDYPLSFGGPDVCPFCDSGQFDGAAMFLVNNRLRAELTTLRAEHDAHMALLDAAAVQVEHSAMSIYPLLDAIEASRTYDDRKEVSE